MIVLPLEISTLVWGLIILARGRIALSHSRVAEGKPAQWAGFLLLLPLPVGLLASFTYHEVLAAASTPATFANLWPLYLGEAVFTLLCLAGALAIGYVKGAKLLEHEVSWQSWVEVLGVFPLVAGGVALFWFREDIPVIQQVFLWLILLVIALVLWQRGWLKLFGPVLFYDMIRAVRRGRYVWMRCIYAGLLLFILSVTYWNTVNYSSAGDREASARIAENYFEAFMVVQILVVTVLTPAYVAGAIADEKERKTLEFLLATDLRNREIVLSKLLSRLANVTLFILTGLPILSFVQFLGGIDPNLVMAGFGFTAMTMLGLGGISIFHSVAFRRPRDAVAMTYLLVIAYYAIGTTLWGGKMAGWDMMKVQIWFGGPGAPTVATLVDVLNGGNLLIVVFNIGRAGAQGSISAVVPQILLDFAMFHGALATITVGWAILRLRAIALAQFQGKVRTVAQRARLVARPACGELPMLWKEVCVEGGLRFNWTSTFAVTLLFLLSLVPFAIIIWNHWVMGTINQWQSIQAEMNGWIRGIGTLVGCLLLMAVAVRASTAISGERDKQTFDALLTTPLTSGSMLWAKWLGSILSVRLGWIWMAFIWLLGAITGGLHVFALPLVFGAWAIFAGFAAIVGLWFSMTAKSSMRATVWTLLTLFALGVGHWLPWMCCVPFMIMGPAQGIEYLAKFQAGLTPPFVLGFLQFYGEEFAHQHNRKEGLELLFFCLFGVFLWAVAGAIFWTTILSPRFRAITGRDDRVPEGVEANRAPLFGHRQGASSQQQPEVIQALLVEEDPSDGKRG